jgi:ubiquinone/menaquinone biosynthesis C-methylase UbiE
MRRPVQVAPVLLLAAACAYGHPFDVEAEEIATLLALQPGMHVADVGAGDGEFGVALAGVVGPTGHAYIQEIDDGELRKIRRRVKRSDLDHVSVVEGSPSDTMLPDACCDAILLRFVYHHVSEREAMLEGLRRSVRPTGLLLVIERGEQGGHGIPSERLIEEWTAAGFEVVRRQTEWGGHDDHSAVVFRPLP